MLKRFRNTDLRTFRHFRKVVGNLRKSQGFQSSAGYIIMATLPPPGICRAFVTFSSPRASSPLGGVARSHARGDATARGGERKLSLSSALEAACSRVSSLLALLAITEELACRVFFGGKLQCPSLGPGGSKNDPSQDNTPPHAPLVSLLYVF